MIYLIYENESKTLSPAFELPTLASLRFTPPPPITLHSWLLPQPMLAPDPSLSLPTGGVSELPEEARVTSAGLTSVVSFTPRSQLDFGTLLCWADNLLGRQLQPCRVKLVLAGQWPVTAGAGPGMGFGRFTVSGRSRQGRVQGWDLGSSRSVAGHDRGGLRSGIWAVHGQWPVTAGAGPGVGFGRFTVSGRSRQGRAQEWDLGGTRSVAGHGSGGSRSGIWAVHGQWPVTTGAGPGVGIGSSRSVPGHNRGGPRNGIWAVHAQWPVTTGAGPGMEFGRFTVSGRSRQGRAQEWDLGGSRSVAGHGRGGSRSGIWAVHGQWPVTAGAGSGVGFGRFTVSGRSRQGRAQEWDLGGLRSVAGHGRGGLRSGIWAVHGQWPVTTGAGSGVGFGRFTVSGRSRQGRAQEWDLGGSRSVAGHDRGGLRSGIWAVYGQWPVTTGAGSGVGFGRFTVSGRSRQGRVQEWNLGVSTRRPNVTSCPTSTLREARPTAQLFRAEPDHRQPGDGL